MRLCGAWLACAAAAALAQGAERVSPFTIDYVYSPNSSRSLHVYWKTEGPRQAIVEVVAQTNAQPAHVERVEGTIFSVSGSVYEYRVTIETLVPDTNYRYRIGDGAEWTEWRSFTTASSAVNYPPGRLPDRVILTWPGDPATTMAVTWRTEHTVSRACAEIALASDSPAPRESDEWERSSLQKYLHPPGRQVPAHTETSVTQVKASYHSARFSALKPETTYAYRVGDCERAWSGWFQFTTASAKPKPFSFIYFGDIQNNIRSVAARVVRQAILSHPQAKFHVYAGDLVGTSNDLYWGEWFESAGWVLGSIPTIPTTGNHEYENWARRRPGAPTPRPGSLPYWRQLFTLPEHGPRGQEETVYYIDHQGVRFISLNSTELLYLPETRAAQLRWLRQVLEENPNRWTCVIFHHPIWAVSLSSDGTVGEGFLDWLKPLFDEYRVDLVMTGHTHYYTRGRRLRRADASSSAASHTVYLTSSATPATADGARSWNPDWDRAGEDLQLYQVVTIDAGKLSFEAYTATGRLYDAFDLLKQSGGRPNKLINRIPGDYPEHLRPHP